MIEQSAARFGDSLAVACVAEDATRTHTFSSLDAASNRTANGFLDAGIGFGDPVAMLSHNSIAFVEAFFATQKIGARVTPINVRFDAADVKDVLDDTEGDWVVSYDDLPEAVAELVEAGNAFVVERGYGARSGGYQHGESKSTTERLVTSFDPRVTPGFAAGGKQATLDY